MQRSYQKRLVDPLITDLLANLPAISLQGPRAAGKTTTALQHAKTVVRLDKEAEALPFRADPDAALRTLAPPVLLDEWQEVPAALGAVKRAVDRDNSGGQFLLTGSVHAELDVATWPGTGRVVDIPIGGLVMREISGDATSTSFLDRIVKPQLDLPDRIEDFDLRDCAHAAVVGGFPESVFLSSPLARRRWFATYVRQLVSRDALHVSPGRDPIKLRRYLDVLALHTACIVDEQTLFGRAGIDRKTAASYESLLHDLYIVETIPAWSSNRFKRLVQAPKRYISDSGLAAWIAGTNADGVIRDGKILGQLVDTFVLAQLRAEKEVSISDARFFHVREKSGGREIDLIIEYAGGYIVGVEIKATSTPTSADARHLAWFRDQLGDRFIRGIVFHTGPSRWSLGERIDALPIAAIWTSN